MLTRTYRMSIKFVAGDRDKKLIDELDLNSLAETVCTNATDDGLAVDVEVREEPENVPEEKVPCNWKPDTDGENEKDVSDELKEDEVHCIWKPDTDGERVKAVSDELKEDGLDEAVNHPPYYWDKTIGHECIEFTANMSFLMGSAFKYVWRAGRKDGESTEKDLRKARFYVRRAIRERVCSKLVFDDFNELNDALGSAVDATGGPYGKARYMVLRDLFLNYKEAAIEKVDYLLKLVAGESGEHNTP